MGLIDVDWRDIESKAGELESVASDLQRTINNQLNAMRTGGGSGWQGSAADLYRKRADKFLRQVQNDRKQAKKTAEALRSAAGKYRDLELLSQSLFGG